MIELLAMRDSFSVSSEISVPSGSGSSEQQGQGQGQQSSSSGNHRRTIILNGLDSPHSSGHWDESPEDLALTVSRFSTVLERLAMETVFLSTSLRLPQHLSLCQRLLSLSVRYQSQSLPTATATAAQGSHGDGGGEGDEEEDMLHYHRCGLLDLLAGTTLSYALALTSHLRPLVPGTVSSKVRLLQSRARGRGQLFLSADNASGSGSSVMTAAQFEEFSVKTLLLPLSSGMAIPQKIFRIFVHCLLSLTALATPDSVRNILGKIFGTGASLLSVLRLLSMSSHPLDLPSQEIHCLRRASHLILSWISSRSVLSCPSLSLPLSASLCLTLSPSPSLSLSL
jgi:hypothetical protein